MNEVVSSIGWPHVALILGIVFIFLFRKSISGLIARIRGISKDGFTADATPESQLEKADPNAVQELLEVIGRSVVIDDLEQRIISTLTEKGLKVEGDTCKVLVRHLAGTQLLLELEQIHSFIFGTQIFLLKKLNEVAGQGRPIDYVHSYVQFAISKSPKLLSKWNFDLYLEFLFARALIIQHEDTIHITNLGVEYLAWMARAGRNEDRPL